MNSLCTNYLFKRTHIRISSQKNPITPKTLKQMYKLISDFFPSHSHSTKLIDKRSFASIHGFIIKNVVHISRWWKMRIRITNRKINEWTKWMNPWLNETGTGARANELSTNDSSSNSKNVHVHKHTHRMQNKTRFMRWHDTAFTRTHSRAPWLYLRWSSSNTHRYIIYINVFAKISATFCLAIN